MAKKKKRGLSFVSPERRKEIARKGYLAAKKKGKIHQWTPDEARAAQAVTQHPEDKIFRDLTARMRGEWEEK